MEEVVVAMMWMMWSDERRFLYFLCCVVRRVLLIPLSSFNLSLASSHTLQCTIAIAITHSGGPTKHNEVTTTRPNTGLPQL